MSRNPPQVFKRFNINLPENQLRSLMKEFDTDGSGRIDFQEFIDCLLQVRGKIECPFTGMCGD
jgi:Ca2+-binding EF-hand superfamily protein